MTDHQDYTIEELIPAEKISARVAEMARQITAQFQSTENLIMIGLLRGSLIFMSDLMRQIDLPLEVDFMEVRSYGDSTKSSGQIKVLSDLRTIIENQNILIVEDIVDTGHTLHHVSALLKERHPARMEICVLLDKPSRREADVQVDITGFEIPDQFVVGYGMDYAQRHRNLPYIGVVKFPDSGS